MLTERATYDELIKPYNEAKEYGYHGYNNPRIMREFRHGKKEVWYRTRTPKSKSQVLYYYIRSPKMSNLFKGTPGSFLHISYLEMEGVHNDQKCTSFFTSCQDEDLLMVIRGHAIYRYMERRHFTGTLEEAQRKILSGIGVFDVQKDTTTGYIYFDGGAFLCERKPKVLTLGTFVMNSGLYPVQRIKSLKSEKATNELKEKAGLI